MSEEELRRHEAICRYAMMSAIMAVGKPEESLSKIVFELYRLRSELDSERTKHQKLWQLVDKELDRIYCDAKGVER